MNGRWDRVRAVVVAAVLVTATAAVTLLGARPAGAISLRDGDIVVDDVGGHVFATVEDSVVIYDLDARVVATIPGQTEASDLVLRGRSVYVLAAGGGGAARINRIDADSLAVTGGWDLGVRAWGMGFVGDDVWFSTAISGATGLGRLVTATGAVTNFPGISPYLSYVQTSTSPARVYTLDKGITPASLRTFDVSSGTPVALGVAGRQNFPCPTDTTQLLASGDGSTGWTSCGPAAGFSGWAPGVVATDLAPLSIPVNRRALRLSADGQYFLASLSGNYSSPDIGLYRTGSPASTVATWDLSSTGSTPSMVAMSADGRRLFVMADDGVLRVVKLMEPGAVRSLQNVAGATSATVSWQAPSDTGRLPVTGYVVTPEVDGVIQPSVSFDASTTTRSIPGLPVGATVRFGVVATNLMGAGPTAWSSSARIGAPSAPTAVTAAPGDGSARLSWTAPATDNGSPITGYRVTPFVGASAQPPITLASADTTQVVPGLQNGISYTFTVAALNAAGEGVTSGATTIPVTVGTPTAPGTPVAVAGASSALVSWTAPASDNGSPITGYRVTRRDAYATTRTWTFDSTATEQTITGLVDGEWHTFYVAAINARGIGSESSGSPPISPSTTPGPPTNVVGVSKTGSVDLSWSPAAWGGMPTLGYVVTPYIGAAAQPPITFASASTAQTITGLTDGTAYTFTVTAYNANGSGPPSLPSAPVTPRHYPNAPTGVVAVAGPGRADLSWVAPTDPGESPVTSYEVTASGIPRNAGNPPPPVLTTTVFPGTSGTVTGLNNGWTYTFTVTARNGAGAGPASAPSSGVIPLTVPGAPSNVRAEMNGKSVSMDWTKPTDDGGTNLNGYDITPYLGTTALPSVHVAGTQWPITGLTPGLTYTFAVTARNSQGSGPAATSDPVAVEWVPDPPSSLTVVPGDRSLHIDWGVPADIGGRPILGYEVVVNSDGSTFQQVVPAEPTEITVGDLQNGVPYRVGIRALNAVGYSKVVAEYGVVPLPPAPPTARGTVRDAARNPIPGAVVQIAGYPAMTTDASGAFVAAVSIPDGTYAIQVRAVCRTPLSLLIDISRNTVGDDLVLEGFTGRCSVDAQVWDPTSTVLPLSGDDASTAVALPFPYVHAGVTANSADISTNGVVSFAGPVTTASNTAIPSPAAPNAAIYGFWDDLVVDGSASVRTGTSGPVGSRRFTIEWRNVALAADPAVRFSFQVVLYEDPNQRVRLQYRGIVAGNLAAGSSATVGQENAAGNSGTQVIFNQGLLYDGLSVRPK